MLLHLMVAFRLKIDKLYQRNPKTSQRCDDSIELKVYHVIPIKVCNKRMIIFHKVSNRVE